MKLNLTEEEESIFNEIRGFSLKIGVIPRVAGGWVRDKILGIPTHDIDIAIDKMSGYEFVNKLKYENNLSIGIGKIKSNPDKSKHLETAVAVIQGVPIDFLHLRNESYSDSRIPLITPGLPFEDAFRRDLTINSLFYNLITGKVEDFTNKGLDDIKNKILRTPLDPKRTFYDDPLRILRIIRFSTKLKFGIHSETYDAMKSKNIKKFLEKKVSNERISIEIQKILECKNYHDGFIRIIDCDLIYPIFKYNISLKLEDYLKFINIEILEKDSLFENENFFKKLYSILYFSSGIIEDQNFINEVIVSKSLMFKNEVKKIVKKIEENLNYLQKIDENNDIEFLKYLNVKFFLKGEKVFQFHKSIVEMIRFMGKEWKISMEIYNKEKLFRDERTNIIEIYKLIYKLNYEKVFTVKPLVKGEEIKKLMNVSGPEIKKYIEMGCVYSIIYPEATRESIKSYLLSKKK